jgi:hypothetical protein
LAANAPKRFLKALKALKALARVIHMQQESYYQPGAPSSSGNQPITNASTEWLAGRGSRQPDAESIGAVVAILTRPLWLEWALRPIPRYLPESHQEDHRLGEAIRRRTSCAVGADDGTIARCPGTSLRPVMRAGCCTPAKYWNLVSATSNKGKVTLVSAK